MQKYSLYKMMIAALVMVTLATASFVVISANVSAAPALQQVRAKEVTGTLPGGQFAQIWLALQPETSGAQVTLTAEWDRNNPADQGLNFFILDDQGVRRVGEDALSTIALGAGSSNFVLNGPANVIGASFNAIGVATYTIVVANDSNQDASFTLRATNAFIIDESGQVTDPNATVVADTEESAEGDEATDEVASDDAAAEEVATEETAETTVALTTTVVSTATTISTETVEATATPAPAAAPATSGPVRTTSLSGSLPEQNDQHFLGLEPNGRDVQITLRLTIEPQDNSELARRLNFWVLDDNGFSQFLGGTDPSDVAIAAGNRVFRGLDNERVASFRVVGSGSYTVLVYNNATVPGTYELSIEGGVLVDDAGQTNEAQTSGSTLSATGTVTTSTTSTATTSTTDATDTTDSAADTTTTTTARSGEAGGTYIVQSGDTLALIARDIYGDLNLYDEICAFNNLADCNVIEIGDEIQLPTQAQISSNARAAATPTPAPTTAPAAADDSTAESDSAASTEETVAATPTVTSTDTTTDTATTTDTTATDTTSDDTASADEASATGDSIYDTLVANGNFTTLVKGLDQAGLDAVLDGTGEYTLFAPTDAAFVALRNRFNLSEDALLGLQEFPDTMRYHVLSGAILSGDVTDGMTASTLQGKAVRFEIDGDTVTINGANIIAADVPASNGVIHVIDAVIITPQD